MRATCEVWDANLKAFLVLLRLVFDDLPVLVKNLPHPGVPLENAVIQPNVRRREVDALNEEGQAVLRIHQSLRQLHHVGGLHLLNVGLQENTQVTDRLVRAPRKDTRAHQNRGPQLGTSAQVMSGPSQPLPRRMPGIPGK